MYDKQHVDDEVKTAMRAGKWVEGTV